MENRLGSRHLPAHARQLQALGVDRLASRLSDPAAARNAHAFVPRIAHQLRPPAEIVVRFAKIVLPLLPFRQVPGPQDRRRVQHTPNAVGLLEQLQHAPHPRPARRVLAEQGLGHLPDIFARVVVVEHAEPIQPLARARMTHPPQHLVVVGRFVVARVRHVAQTRQWLVPALQHLADQPRQLFGHAGLLRLGRVGQIDRSQTLPATIVHRYRPGARHFINRPAFHRHAERNAVPAHAQHRLVSARARPRLFQQFQQLFYLNFMTPIGHRLGDVADHLAQFRGTPGDVVLLFQALQRPSLGGAGLGLVVGRTFGQRGVAPAMSPSCCSSGKIVGPPLLSVGR